MSRMLTVSCLAGLALPFLALTGQAPTDGLRPGDALRLRIFQEPTLSGEFQVNENGIVTLPRLGEIMIVAWPADSIRPRLTTAFSEFLREPVIEVTLLRRLAIFGAVRQPGLYPVDPTMTVQEALALAGGAAPDGRNDRVELIRGDERIETDLSEGARLDQLSLRSGDQLYVPQRSWLARNTWLLGSAIGAVVTVIAVTAN